MHFFRRLQTRRINLITVTLQCAIFMNEQTFLEISWMSNMAIMMLDSKEIYVNTPLSSELDNFHFLCDLNVNSVKNVFLS